MIIGDNEDHIARINFYSGAKRLVAVGWPNDEKVKEINGRVELFEIADEEELIGCKLDHCKDYLRGVTWLKMKVRF